jgi:hypothetical protein
MEERRGSLTLFTNGRRLAVDSLLARGHIDETWLQGRCFEEAVRRLEKRLPGIPWGETRHQGDGPRSGPASSR